MSLRNGLAPELHSKPITLVTFLCRHRKSYNQKIMGVAGAWTTTSTTSSAAPSLVHANSVLVRYSLPIALFLAIFAGSVPAIPSADTWWHLRAGEYIVETGSVPKVDPFSYSVAGQAWIAHEWLSEVITYISFNLGGTSGMLLFFAMLGTITFAFVYLRTRSAPFPARALAVLLGLWTTAPTFSV